jgi:hypothetical protein
MMKRALRFSLVLAAALAVVPFLPLYIERTMKRSWRVDHLPDLIEWGWKVCTLHTYWSDYRYFKREQNPALWLGVNLALALTYALVIALIVDRVLARRKRREAGIR